jgi:hypothetical protein
MKIKYLGGTSMINSKDILTRLQNGENVDAIANEMMDALNAANDQFQKEEEEKKKAAAMIDDKAADLRVILDMLYNFCKKHYCDNDEDLAALDEAFADMDAFEIIKQVEELGAMVVNMKEMFNNSPIFNFVIEDKPVGNTKKKVIESKKDADFVINSFLKSIGL